MFVIPNTYSDPTGNACGGGVQGGSTPNGKVESVRGVDASGERRSRQADRRTPIREAAASTRNDPVRI